MKILLLNGSPRRGGASSRIILDLFRARLGEDHQWSMAETMPRGAARPEDLEADLILAAFPLYVDSLPSGMLEWLLSYRELKSRSTATKGSPKTALIAVANCGFHEGEQNRTALEILRNFCHSVDVSWLGGLGIGTGEMIKELKDAPGDMFIKKPVTDALEELAARAAGFVSGSQSGLPPVDAEEPKVSFVQHAFPRFLYRLAGHAGWKKMARQNGLKPGDLWARPVEL